MPLGHWQKKMHFEQNQWVSIKGLFLLKFADCRPEIKLWLKYKTRIFNLE